MRLILVRHGDSRHMHQGVIAGVVSCTGLTDHGVVQAHQLAAHLATTGELSNCSALLASPVKRAQETAEILASVLPIKTIETDCDLCELHPGAADGLTWDQYRSRYGGFDLLAHPDRPFAPDGESWAGFVSRVHATLDRLAERFAGQTVVAVSHAGFIVVSILDRFHIPPAEDRARLDPLPASLTEWRVSNGVWRLERYNDTASIRAHL